MRVLKVFNNNALMANDAEKGDLILLGAGIGFYVRKGDEVDQSKIEKVFVGSENSTLFDLLKQIPSLYLTITDEIVQYARMNDMRLSDSVYLALTDHIYFAIDRIKKGYDLDNPYLIDIVHFYPKEYHVGRYAGKIIKKYLDVDVPEYELGYITMHLIENSDSSGNNFKNELSIIEDTVNFLKSNYLKSVEEDSLAYSRLITHVKYFAKRYIDRDIEKTEDKELDEVLRKSFREEFKVVEELNHFLIGKYKYPISNSEKNYLVLHIRNCKGK